MLFGEEDLLRDLKLNIKFSDISFFFPILDAFLGGVVLRECDLGHLAAMASRVRLVTLLQRMEVKESISERGIFLEN